MRFCAILCTLTIATIALGQGFKPARDYVPDASTAVKIAEAVLIPVYGKKQIESERPFTAKLKNGIWTVGGTLHCLDKKGRSTNLCDGGVAVVQISKVDAHIISMAHYK